MVRFRSGHAFSLLPTEKSNYEQEKSLEEERLIMVWHKGPTWLFLIWCIFVLRSLAIWMRRRRAWKKKRWSWYGARDLLECFWFDVFVLRSLVIWMSTLECVGRFAPTWLLKNVSQGALTYVAKVIFYNNLQNCIFLHTLVIQDHMHVRLRQGGSCSELQIFFSGSLQHQWNLNLIKCSPSGSY